MISLINHHTQTGWRQGMPDLLHDVTILQLDGISCQLAHTELGTLEVTQAFHLGGMPLGSVSTSAVCNICKCKYVCFTYACIYIYILCVFIYIYKYTYIMYTYMYIL